MGGNDKSSGPLIWNAKKGKRYPHQNINNPKKRVISLIGQPSTIRYSDCFLLIGDSGIGLLVRSVR